MKILALTDYYYYDIPIEEITRLITDNQIDIIILLGGLFRNEVREEKMQEKGKAKVKTKAKSTKKLINDANSILRMNWLLKPILAIPSFVDLGNKKLIKQIQAQDAFNIRYLNNTATILDSWLFLGLTQIDSDLDKYIKMSEENLLILYTGEDISVFKEYLNLNILSKSKLESINNSFVVNIDSIKENLATIIDLVTKTVISIPLKF